jgi:hypothetical protein
MDHWLVRTSSIRKLWGVFAVTLAATVLIDAFVEHHAAFGVDGTIGFGAWFGFASCIGLILFAKLLGAILKRPDGFYDR